MKISELRAVGFLKKNGFFKSRAKHIPGDLPWLQESPAERDLDEGGKGSAVEQLRHQDVSIDTEVCAPDDNLHVNEEVSADCVSADQVGEDVGVPVEGGDNSQNAKSKFKRLGRVGNSVNVAGFSKWLAVPVVLMSAILFYHVDFSGIEWQSLDCTSLKSANTHNGRCDFSSESGFVSTDNNTSLFTVSQLPDSSNDELDQVHDSNNMRNTGQAGRTTSQYISQRKGGDICEGRDSLVVSGAGGLLGSLLGNSEYVTCGSSAPPRNMRPQYGSEGQLLLPYERRLQERERVDSYF